MKTIVLCSSMAFYKHLDELSRELEKMGFTAVVPETVLKMRAENDYSDQARRTWFNDPKDFAKKRELMRGHFKKVAGGDAVLVVNDEKHGVRGYIGPNVLMEMGLAFHLEKKIYVLNDVDKSVPVYEEVYGLGSVILDGDLTKIKAD